VKYRLPVGLGEKQLNKVALLFVSLSMILKQSGVELIAVRRMYLEKRWFVKSYSAQEINLEVK